MLTKGATGTLKRDFIPALNASVFVRGHTPLPERLTPPRSQIAEPMLEPTRNPVPQLICPLQRQHDLAKSERALILFSSFFSFFLLVFNGCF